MDLQCLEKGRSQGIMINVLMKKSQCRGSTLRRHMTWAWGSGRFPGGGWEKQAGRSRDETPTLECHERQGYSSLGAEDGRIDCPCEGPHGGVS